MTEIVVSYYLTILVKSTYYWGVMNITDIEFDGSRIPNFAKGKSLNQIALSVGISRQFMGEIVKGGSKPSSDVALRIAAALGCSVDDFSNKKNLKNLSATT